MLKRDNHLAKKNIIVLVLTVLCFLLMAAGIFVCIWAKLNTNTMADTPGETEYIIVVEDKITAYEGDERLITPRLIDGNGNLQQGRFTYAVVDRDAAPIMVSELGVVSVKAGSEATSAQIEVTELNTQTKTKISVSVVRKLSGVKGIVFGDELVVTTTRQTLTLGNEYSVTVKTIPSQADLREATISIKTVDRFGKEVTDVLDYEVIAGTTRITITPKGLGEGAMVFSVIADGVELCKDENYEFGVSIQNSVLHDEVFGQLKNIVESDPVKRERIELVSATALAQLETIRVAKSVDSLHGLSKTYFPNLETVIFESDSLMTFADEEASKDLCYRVRERLYDAYTQDEFWQDYAYNLIPYATNATTEKWAVFHTFNGTSIKIINETFSLAETKFTATGYVNNYFYTGKDPRPNTAQERQTATDAVTAQINNELKNGLHINVGYTAIEYSVKYVVEAEEGVENAIECSDLRDWKYDETKLLYTAEQIEDATNKSVGRKGYRFDGWYINKLHPDDVLDLKTEYGNFMDETGTVTLYAHWSPVQYMIEFKDAEGVNNMTLNYDEEFKLPKPLKTGYTFEYYTDSSGKKYPDEGEDIDTQTYKNLFDTENVLTLVAQYRANTYTVVFDKDGGVWTTTGLRDSVQLRYDERLDLNAYTLNRVGKTGYEWAQIDTAGNQIDGQHFSSTDMISNLTSVDGGRVTLKAFWDPIKYQIVYSFPGFSYTYKDKNSITQTAFGTFTQERMYGDGVAFISLTREGYTATQWRALYFTEKGSSVQNKLNDRYDLGKKKDLVPGASAEETGRTYYFELIFNANSYTVTFDYNGATTTGVSSKSVTYDGTYGTLPTPTREGYKFLGWKYNGSTIAEGTVVKTAKAHTLTADWQAMPLTVTISSSPNDLKSIAKNGSESVTVSVRGGSGSYSYSPNPPSGSGDGYSWSFNSSTGRLTVSVSKKDLSGTITITVKDTVYGSTATISQPWSSEGSCVTMGTLVTLVDGSQKPVEDLTGDEMLLVWNFLTGTFDAAPILCIDEDDKAVYRVINLFFSDGTTVKVVSEHGFFDATLKKFVYLDEKAAQYIGHEFNKQSLINGELVYTTVRLTGVRIEEEVTTTYSPVTYSYLCIYVNGMLSMPGGIEGLFNIFDVDVENMCYDPLAMEADIALYGTYTYEELHELIPIPEELFEAITASYLKVAVGKGLITIDGLRALFESYMSLLGLDSGV